MAPRSHTLNGIVALSIILFFFSKPAHAFGAGNIAKNAALNDYVWKHGDIGDVLSLLPVSFHTNYVFTKLDILRVYFGNWLRDYSQVVDIMTLGEASEPTLRAIVSVLGFMEFGLATEEFDVTKERLGCYRPEEHIDNPRGYAEKNGEYIGDSIIDSLDSRLRRQVMSKELAIDLETGMKNYIANERLDIMTSAGYIRRKIRECVESGRKARRGSDQDWHEALISLGALLHTLEDFSAHSNYVELTLQCIGEKDIFACVGDKCRVTIPNTTEEVPPLVTGTFGSLDVFQSIIGEMDDKAAMTSKGELGFLDQALHNAPEFESVVATIASGLKYISVLIPGGKEMKTDLDEIRKAVQASKSSKDDDSKTEAVHIDTEAIWRLIEPIFSFQGKLKRFLIESKEHPQVKMITEAMDSIGEKIDELVYSALAVIIEPAIQQVREAIKDGKEKIERADRNNSRYVDIFANGSEASDPSHSILAKDHFSNYLNPVAGQVATATTNWTTQQIVKCWDTDDENDLVRSTEAILEILHHPAFAVASGQSVIQKTMYSIVQRWWNQLGDSQKGDLRAALNRDGVAANSDGHYHGDNNPIQAAERTKSFVSDQGFALNWDGSRPTLVPRPTVPNLRADFVKVVNDMGQAFEATCKSLEEGAVEVAELITKGFDTAGDAIDETVGEIGKGLKRGFHEVTSTVEDWAEEAERGGKKVLDEATRFGQQVFNGVEETGTEIAHAVEGTVDDIARGAEQIATGLGNFVDNSANEVVHQVQDFGNKAEEVFNDVGRALTSWW